MRNTIARWDFRLWLRPLPPRDYAANAFCFLFPKTWLNRRLARNQWDEKEIEFLDLMVDPGKAAIDVGANAGKYAYSLSVLAPKVYAFEPDPMLAAKIGRALPSNVEVHAAAVSNKSGVARLVFPVISGRPSTALSSIEPGVLGAATQTVTIEVPTVQLDDLACGPVGFIKIDVEGHELSVLEGAAELIARDRPVIMVEAEERHRAGAVASVRAFMEAHNFDGFFILGDTLRKIEELTSDMQSVSELDESKTRLQMSYVNNFIFVPEEKSTDFAKAMQDRLAEGRHGVESFSESKTPVPAA